MSNVKEVHGKPRLHVPVNLLFCRMTAILCDSTTVIVVRTRPRAILLAMITMRNSTHGFPLVFYRGMGLRLAFGPPELCYQLYQSISNMSNRNNVTKHRSRMANENEPSKLQSFKKRLIIMQLRFWEIRCIEKTCNNYYIHVHVYKPQSQRQKHSFVILHIDNFL